jgi:hypothetical protein
VSLDHSFATWTMPTAALAGLSFTRTVSEEMTRAEPANAPPRHVRAIHPCPPGLQCQTKHGDLADRQSGSRTVQEFIAPQVYAPGCFIAHHTM